MTTPTYTPTLANGTWVVDPDRSTLEFAIRHFGVLTARGRFGGFEGTLSLPDGIARGRVEVASIDTGIARRDAHLRSAALFDAERHPELRFASESVELAAGRVQIRGELTVNGEPREVVLEGSATERGVLELTGRLSRAGLGLRFRGAAAGANLVVADAIELKLSLSLALWDH